MCWLTNFPLTIEKAIQAHEGPINRYRFALFTREEYAEAYKTARAARITCKHLKAREGIPIIQNLISEDLENKFWGKKREVIPYLAKDLALNMYEQGWGTTNIRKYVIGVAEKEDNYLAFWGDGTGY